MTRCVIVVPAYNEAHRLDAEAFRRFIDADSRHHLLFVDDGSTDGTRQLLRQLAASRPSRIEVAELERNAGKAEAVRQGVVRALGSGAELVGFCDADLSAPLVEVSRLHADLEAHPTVVAALGSRVKLLGRDISRSEVRHYLGRVFATCASIALGLPVYDTQCGLKLFRNTDAVRTSVATPFTSKWIFDVELIARLHRATRPAQAIREVPLERWHERGSSRLRLADFARAPLELWRIAREARR